LRSGTPSSDLDNRDVDELNYGIDDDDDLMEPASEPATEPVSEPASEPASEPVSEPDNAKLKQQCISTVNLKNRRITGLYR